MNDSILFESIYTKDKKVNKEEIILIEERPKCECGCGQSVNFSIKYPEIFNRYIHGHNGKKMNQGRVMSKETKNKISMANKGHIPWCLGKRLSEEHRKKLSKAKVGIVPWNKGKKGIITAWNKGLIGYCKGKFVSEETKKKMGQGIKKAWDSYSEEERNQRVKKWSKNMHFRPNKVEEKLFNILESLYPGEWKYTGDFSFIINGKSPDFTNINGQKKLIELFGDYWHQGENEEDRIQAFKSFGYDTLIVWEHQLKHPEDVKSIISKFHSGV